ncbi:MAG: two-component sensor histidine kinase [Desulfobacterales bacterium]|nr:two-component sensor histidine kinase [Desulfobacterales bacterium]
MVMEKQKLQSEKPFNLVKYFTFSSLIVMFIATIIISVLNTHWAKRTLMEKSKEYDHLLVQNLNHQIYIRFVLPTVLLEGKIELRKDQQYKEMDNVIKSTLHGFNVEMVNIYGDNNLIAYSFDKNQVGTKHAGGVEYKKAIKKESTSKFVKEGNSFEIFFDIPKRTQIITFAPLQMEEQGSQTLSGQVIGVIEIVRDVSEEFKKLAKLQGMILASCFMVMSILFILLRVVVKKREKIIEEKAEERLKLKEKLRKAEHLSAIGEMTAGVSHEIRNPLGIIKSSAELLKKQIVRNGLNTTIPDIIIEESSRLNNIIKDFLDFAKPKMPDLHPCQVEQIVEKNIAFFLPQAENSRFEIEKKFESNLPEIMVDSSMLYQAFLNIFINSFQATGGTGKVIVEIFFNGDNIVINFLDQGNGIKEKDLEKIWTPFYTTKDSGTGLGLGIVKNIIDAHNGSIEISNRKLKGAKVTIQLPVKWS